MNESSYEIPTRIIITEDVPEPLNFIDICGVRYLRRGVDIMAFYKAQPTDIWINGRHVRVSEMMEP